MAGRNQSPLVQGEREFLDHRVRKVGKKENISLALSRMTNFQPHFQEIYRTVKEKYCVAAIFVV